MLLLTLIFLPLAGGIASLLIPWSLTRRGLLLAVSLGHLSLTLLAAFLRPDGLWNGIILLDDLGLLMLLVQSLLFSAVSVYAFNSLQEEDTGLRRDFEHGFKFVNAPEAVFICCLLIFLSAMTLVSLTQHLGLLWVGIEATTLASAPLIYFHRHKRSLEATWKYLIICSVGIALALMGNVLLTISLQSSGSFHIAMTVSDLQSQANALHPAWFKAAFIFILVGYGTKMGLAPMHTWLPDAHSESPSLVSALLSGALLNCAFLGILRVWQVCLAVGLEDFGRDLLLALGLFSMLVAAFFIVHQNNFKRMLAYSSVEHMGILALGTALGSGAGLGVMLHMFNHSLCKAALFLAAGNIVQRYNSKNFEEISGLARAMPITGVLWVMGFLAITGSPPFGVFISEFIILKAILAELPWWVAGLYLLCLGVIFVGMSTAVLHMYQDKPPAHILIRRREPLCRILPISVLMALVLLLGVYIPDSFWQLIHQAAALIQS